MSEVSFADQGITSVKNTILAKALRSHFPGIAAHDLYRYTSLDMLRTTWDSATASPLAQRVGPAGAASLEVGHCSVLTGSAVASVHSRRTKY